MMMQLTTVTKAIAYLSLIFLCTHQCVASPPDHNPTQLEARAGVQDKAFVRMNSLLASGEFIVTVEQLSERDATRLQLVGRMWDADFKGDGVPDNAWGASLTFVFSEPESAIRSLGSLRTWKAGDTTELYSAEPIAPNAALWTLKTSPEIGNFEVWNGEQAHGRLTDSMIIPLFHAMVLPERNGEGDQRGTSCTPSYGECFNSATNSCNNGIASFEYHCEDGVVTCKFSCHAPDPKPGPE